MAKRKDVPTVGTRPNLAESYLAAQPDYENLRAAAERAVRVMVEQTGVSTHTISSRVKAYASCCAKLEDRGMRALTRDDLEQLTDVVGIRVVCYFRSDVEVVAAALVKGLAKAELHDHTAEFHLSQTGYQSAHVVASLPRAFRSPEFDMPFEVQVRTVGMDAWASISHLLAYKSDDSVPAKLLAKFKALSGLFYVADDEFEALYAMSQEAQEAAVAAVTTTSPGLLMREPTTLESLTAYLDVRFPDRERADRNSIARLTAELLRYGFETIGAVDRMVEENHDYALAYDSEMPEAPFFNAAGMARVALERALDGEHGRPVDDGEVA